MTPQQEKALAIAQSVIKAALAVSRVANEPIPNARLMRKMPFNRPKMHNRKARHLKSIARQQTAFKMARMAANVAMTAAQIGIIQSRPVPKFLDGAPPSATH